MGLVRSVESERRKYKRIKTCQQRAREVQRLHGRVVKHTAAEICLPTTWPFLTSLLEALTELHLQELELPFNYR